MKKIKSLDELKNLRDDLKSKAQVLSTKDHPESIIQIRVTMATCGIASGSRSVLDFLNDELSKRNISARVTQAGCMGFCYAEPTIEVTIPGKAPVMFGFVDTRKADEIIERYIRKGELPGGVIPMNYEIAGTN